MLRYGALHICLWYDAILLHFAKFRWNATTGCRVIVIKWFSIWRPFDIVNSIYFHFLFTWCREIEICCCTTNLIKIECISADMWCFFTIFVMAAVRQLAFLKFPVWSRDFHCLAILLAHAKFHRNRTISCRQDDVITWQLSAILNFIGLNYYFWSRDCRRVRIC